MTLPNFLDIFDQRLIKLKKSIERELKKPKKDRDKRALKEWVKEARKMRNTIKSAKKETVKHCPHCNGELPW